MSRVASALDRAWFPETPAARLAVLRGLTGLYATVYLLVRTPYLLSFAEQPPDRFLPVGVASLLEGPLPPSAYRATVVLLLPLSVAFVAGVRHRVLGPVFAVGLLAVLTYANSFGKILHTDNLLVIHVGLLALSPAADALSFDARGHPAPAPSGRYGWPVRLMCLACVLVYLLAGIAKLRHGGLAFLEDDSLRNYVAFGAVRKVELGSHHSPFGVALLPYRGLFSALALGSLLLELLSPVALLHPRAGRLFALSVWAFHVGVAALMAIGFFYQLSFVAFACFFPVERLAAWGPLRRLSGRAGPA